jgi:hypothetical protein
LPPHGWSAAQLSDSREQLEDDLRRMRDALALGNVAAVEGHVLEALDTFGINLAESSASRPLLGIAVMRAYVRALQAIGQRNEGNTSENPRTLLGADWQEKTARQRERGSRYGAEIENDQTPKVDGDLGAKEADGETQD